MPKILSTYTVDGEEMIQVGTEFPDEFIDLIAPVAQVVRDTMQGHLIDLFAVRIAEDSPDAGDP